MSKIGVPPWKERGNYTLLRRGVQGAQREYGLLSKDLRFVFNKVASEILAVKKRDVVFVSRYLVSKSAMVIPVHGNRDINALHLGKMKYYVLLKPLRGGRA